MIACNFSHNLIIKIGKKNLSSSWKTFDDELWQNEKTGWVAKYSPGYSIGYGPVKTLEECQKLCDENKNCSYIEYVSGCGRNFCGKRSDYCFQKDKCYADSEIYLEQNYMGFRGYFKDCNGNIFN